MYIADLHIHSHYSRATSRDCNLENLELWARRKGLHIVGTGDFTHPAWREEMAEKLEPAEEGLYVLKKDYRIRDDSVAGSWIPRFAVTGEISSIYKKNEKVRKVHSLLLLPGIREAELLSEKLETIGNIHSDGRPILGLDCRDLLEIMLTVCPGAVYVPAHIWTPHFSLFGAFSGFNTVEECFGDLSGYIHAMETGLSSDPPMNWRVSALDSYQLISNSDAHSPAKLGREANLLDIDLSFSGLRRAIQEGRGLGGTIEFFPEEGKYHYDGHRKCGICLSPTEAEKYGGICPVCKRKLTLGVCHRIAQLADREEGYQREGAKPFESLAPLPEVISAAVGRSPTSAGVQKEYRKLTRTLGPEFEILRELPIEEIRGVSGYAIAEGIERLRKGEVSRTPGFDGEYGMIRLFTREEMDGVEGQMNLFEQLHIEMDEGGVEKTVPSLDTSLDTESPKLFRKQEPVEKIAECLNEKQEEAVHACGRATAVIAGPGTGKTRTLTEHLLYLLEVRKVKPSEITAVTFTRQAAAEMQDRLRKQFGKRRNVGQIQMGTFHSICLEFLKKQGMEFLLADDAAASEAAQMAIYELGAEVSPRQLLRSISVEKTGIEKNELRTAYKRILREHNFLDFEDLILETLKVIEEGSACEGWEKPFSYLLVDEFQDISPAQYRLIRLWNQKGKELFVIGDPDQAIYGFRGADTKCFAKLKADEPGLAEIFLEDNYRSAPSVVTAATALISHNSGRERCLKAHRSCKDKVRLVNAEDVMGESIFIAKEINRLAGGIGMLEVQEAAADEGDNKSFGEIAVLYRTHRQAKLLESCLRREGIPYIVAGREDFLMEDEIKGSIAFFKCLAAPEDVFSKEQCVRIFWGKMGRRAAEGIFQDLFEKFYPLYLKKKPQQFLENWTEAAGLKDSEAMEKFGKLALFYKTMPDFMDALRMGVESDLKRCGGKKYNGEAVTLMSLHGAKGKEFPVVFLYGVRKGLIPFAGAGEDIEEERRLFYVGMTRAKEKLILTSSGEPSVFLGELPEAEIKREKADKRKYIPEGKQLTLPF